ncbi:NlpC/P60 family protein [Alkalicaulis satelles]|uniref:NlpC/P60 family protein n=1 Tax=Alkalicaulis satelles TaxID=2609175 RepID=A0A5M6ZJ63_9PROT|nr:NlpC/P60 family protein [Alkalicaulis satelles]KAA5804852.1 NlpC/P60 family protein [Alkalicaulis satelles]
MSAFQVTAGVAPIRKAPADDAEQISQLLAGEVFEVEREEDGWGEGVSRHDGYRGWVAMEALSAPVLIATHTISALRTYVFSDAHLKSAPRFLLSMNAKISAGRRSGKFVEAQRLGWVFEGHLAALGAHEDDHAGVAERFVGSPYQWGGKESLGLDCSGLVQIALERCGILIPRDSGQQEAWAREHWQAVAPGEDLSGLQRGDLMFWPGHVGILTAPDTLIHANAFHMATVAEPVARAVLRIAHHHAPVSGVFRKI